MSAAPSGGRADACPECDVPRKTEYTYSPPRSYGVPTSRRYFNSGKAIVLRDPLAVHYPYFNAGSSQAAQHRDRGALKVSSTGAHCPWWTEGTNRTIPDNERANTSIFRMWFPPATFENQFFFSTPDCKYHQFLNTNAIFLHKIDTE